MPTLNSQLALLILCDGVTKNDEPADGVAVSFNVPSITEKSVIAPDQGGFTLKFPSSKESLICEKPVCQTNNKRKIPVAFISFVLENVKSQITNK